MSTSASTAAQIAAALARKYNRYSRGTEVAGRTCANCARKHFSAPLACHDGSSGNDPQWVDRGRNCANWADADAHQA